MDSSFTYIKHKDIDIAKWDKLVDSSDNALIFCYSWYINGFCSWDAIILRDYDGAIALPTKRKFGVKTLFQPNFIQKCVWFGEVLSGEDEIAVWKIIQNNFHQVNFNCNIRLAKTSSQRVNQILPLTIYDSIQLGYSKSLTKNINKHASSLLVKERLSVKNTIGLYKVAYGDLNKQLTAASYNSLEELSVSHPESFLNIHILFESKIIGSLLFAVGKNRLHYILGAPTKEGRSKNALSIALDYVIHKYGQQEMILDFEGSSIPSVKKFYASFGASEELFFENAYISKTLRPLHTLYNKLLRS